MTGKHWGWAALLALALGAATAQDPPADANEPDPSAEEILDDEALDAGEAPIAAEDELPEAPEPDPAAAEGRINATLERFVPSEEISEDRSVAFPNDI